MGLMNLIENPDMKKNPQPTGFLGLTGASAPRVNAPRRSLSRGQPFTMALGDDDVNDAESASGEDFPSKPHVRLNPSSKERSDPSHIHHSIV